MTALEILAIACIAGGVGLAAHWSASNRAIVRILQSGIFVNGVEATGARLAWSDESGRLVLELSGPALCQAYLRSSKIAGGDEAVLSAALDTLIQYADESVDGGGLVLTTRPWQGPGQPQAYRLTVDEVSPADDAKRWESDSLTGAIVYAAMDVDRARMIAERNKKEAEHADR